MKFAYDFQSLPFLLGLAFALLLTGSLVTMLVLAALRRAKAEKAFGDPLRVKDLVSADAKQPRAVKAVLLVAALVFAFVALARPQYGKGTRIVPATNLDVVIVLDFSKSMYARDVVPSRISRAKAEIGKLVRDLGGARFGAVAFAGEPMSFPLTSDGAAIAQFFRQLEPNDMPIGGTATAKALERARELFARDPKSKDHVRVILLVTDGEDLEGDPLAVAESCEREGTRIDVVQIGGRAPELIPDVDSTGRIVGTRRDDSGKPITTELTSEGEAQLAELAKKTGGTLVRSDKGDVALKPIVDKLSHLMREELSERVETVFAEEYRWPLGAAVLLLLAEVFVREAKPKKKKAPSSTLQSTRLRTRTGKKGARRAA